MAVTLDDAIREAARQGRLSHTSIVADPAGRGWQANAPSEHAGAWSVSIDADPVAALLKALRVGPTVAGEPTSTGGVFD